MQSDWLDPEKPILVVYFAYWDAKEEQAIAFVPLYNLTVRGRRNVPAAVEQIKTRIKVRTRENRRADPMPPWELNEHFLAYTRELKRPVSKQRICTASGYLKI